MLACVEAIAVLAATVMKLSAMARGAAGTLIASVYAGISWYLRRPRDMRHSDQPRRVLMLIENLPAPFDRRVWQEACALRDAGYVVSIVCPTGHGCESKFEAIDGIHIYRYHLAYEASSPAGYVLEYGIALSCSFALACWVWLTRGFDAIHACNPPDLFFLIGRFFKLFGKKFVFDHHDLNPELFEAKFGRRGALHSLMLKLEYW